MIIIKKKKKDGCSVRKNPPLICQVSDMALASFLNLFRIPFVMTWGGGVKRREMINKFMTSGSPTPLAAGSLSFVSPFFV